MFHLKLTVICKILLRIKLKESLSTFLNSPVDHSSDIYDRMVSLVNCKSASNVSFEVNGYIFHAIDHFLVSNDYFKALLTGSFIEANQSKTNTPISLKYIEAETFYQILLWRYSGEIPMIWKPSALFELYRTADYFLMKDLCDAIIKFVTATFCEYNFGQVYEFALKIENEELENAVIKKWKENREIFEATDQVKKLLERNEDTEFFLKLVMKLKVIVTQGDEAEDKYSIIKMLKF